MKAQAESERERERERKRELAIKKNSLIQLSIDKNKPNGEREKEEILK